MSGYCATGRVVTVSKPANIINIASTVANIGRLMKNLLNMAYFTIIGLTVMPSRTFSMALVT